MRASGRRKVPQNRYSEESSGLTYVLQDYPKVDVVLWCNTRSTITERDLRLRPIGQFPRRSLAAGEDVLSAWNHWCVPVNRDLDTLSSSTMVNDKA